MQTLLPQDLLKRAELFNEILDIITAFGENPQPIEAAPSVELPDVTRFYPPSILIINQRMVCNGISADLSRRPAILQMVRLFLNNGAQPLSREDIIVGLYGHLDDPKITRRYRESVIANVIKAVSRTRDFLTSHFSDVGIELDWLVYDAMNRVWHFYRSR